MLTTWLLIALLATCIVEAVVSRHPHRARQLYHVRLLVVMAWAAAAVWENWNASSRYGMAFHSVMGARAFGIGYFAMVSTAVATVLLRLRWASLRALLVAANGVTWLVFAFIAGATLDWNESALAPTFLIMHLALFTGLMWMLAGSDKTSANVSERRAESTP